MVFCELGHSDFCPCTPSFFLITLCNIFEITVAIAYVTECERLQAILGRSGLLKGLVKETLRLVAHPQLFEMSELHKVFCHFSKQCFHTVKKALLRRIESREYDIRLRMRSFYRMWTRLLRENEHNPARRWNAFLNNNARLHPYIHLFPSVRAIHSLFNGGYHICQ
jgi:hypothetical protein